MTDGPGTRDAGGSPTPTGDGRAAAARGAGRWRAEAGRVADLAGRVRRVRPAPDEGATAADDGPAASRPPSGGTAGPWTPLGSAGDASVTDTLTTRQYLHLPAQTPSQHRADVVVGPHTVRLAWTPPHTLVAALLGADGSATHEVARGRREVERDVGTFLWPYRPMPLSVDGLAVAVERRDRGGGRRALHVTGPDGRTWSWHAAGRAWSDRFDLVREGERGAVVTHRIPRALDPQLRDLRVSWTEDASLAEVLMPVMWVLDRAYEGLLPTAQAVARGEVMQ